MPIPYSELASQLRGEKPSLAILPTGCYEQHGPVLPLDTDNIIAEAAARKLSGRLSEQYLCHLFPLVPYSTTEPNLGYCGTVSVAADPFRAYLHQIVTGIMRSGFDALLILNSHGSVVGSLKEVAFAAVMDQYQNDAVEAVRPVLALNVFDYDAEISKEFGQPVGRHADWKEFLLLYEVLGTEYFTETRLARLREFQSNNRFDQVMPKVIGIPAEYRTTDGVQGQPLPKDDNYQEAAERLWQLTTERLAETITSELSNFVSLYQAKQRVSPI